MRSTLRQPPNNRPLCALQFSASDHSSRTAQHNSEYDLKRTVSAFQVVLPQEGHTGRGGRTDYNNPLFTFQREPEPRARQAPHRHSFQLSREPNTDQE